MLLGRSWVYLGGIHPIFRSGVPPRRGKHIHPKHYSTGTITTQFESLMHRTRLRKVEGRIVEPELKHPAIGNIHRKRTLRTSCSKRTFLFQRKLHWYPRRPNETFFRVDKVIADEMNGFICFLVFAKPRCSELISGCHQRRQNSRYVLDICSW